MADRMYFVVSLLQLSLGLLLLMLPSQLFVQPRYRQHKVSRPWLVIWPNLAAGLAGVLLSIAEIWHVSSSVRTAILVVAYVNFALLFGVFGWLMLRMWRNSRSVAGQPPGVVLHGELGVGRTDRALDGAHNRELEDEVMHILGYGHKIEAIKRVRERTGWSLKEAKEYVETVEARMQE